MLGLSPRSTCRLRSSATADRRTVTWPRRAPPRSHPSRARPAPARVEPIDSRPQRSKERIHRTARFPIVGMVLVRSPDSATGLHAAASAAEALLGTIIHNPKLRGCTASDARPDAVMCVTTGTLELFGMVKSVVAVVEVHAWVMGPDVIAAAMIQPDKTTTETKQILGSIVGR